MQNTEQPIIDLRRNLDRLTVLSSRTEARLQALEKRRRWFPGLVMGILMVVAFIAGHFSAGPQSAQAGTPVDLVRRTEQAAIAKAKTGIQEVVAVEQKDLARFHNVMEGVRQDINRAQEKAFEPGVAIAVILHDMKRMLEAVPRMADDMHRMTGDMHEMNQKMSAVPAMAAEMNMMNRQIGVMTQGVDSTMGRMGRMMPWAP